MAEFLFVPDITVADSFGLDPNRGLPLTLTSNSHGMRCFTCEEGNLTVSVKLDGGGGVVVLADPKGGSRQMPIEIVPGIDEFGDPLIFAQPHSCLRDSGPLFAPLASLFSPVVGFLTRNS